LNNISSRVHKTSLIISIAALGGSFLWLYYPVIVSMVTEWYENPNHSHGFLVPFISGYFVWTRREKLSSADLRPHWGGVAILSIGLMVYYLGYLAAAHTTMRVSLLMVVAGLIIANLGLNMFRAIIFPFVFLIFMIPVPRYLYDLVAFPLKLFVTKYAVALLNMMGVLVIHEGNIIMLENVTLQVVDACSGIRSLVSIIVVAVTVAYFTQKSTFKKTALVLSAVPVAVAANILRIVLTGILASVYGSSAAEGFFHEFAGLGVFLFETAIIVGLAIIMNRRNGKALDKRI
jgi:exosortase